MAMKMVYFHGGGPKQVLGWPSSGWLVACWVGGG